MYLINGSQSDFQPWTGIGNQTFSGMRIQIAIDDGILYLAFHNRRDRKNRQRKPPVASPGGFRIVEKDHLPTLGLPITRSSFRRTCQRCG